jgi:hypothetical protein
LPVILAKTSNGVFHPKHFLGLLFIKSVALNASRLVSAVVMEISDVWQSSKAYLSLSDLGMLLDLALVSKTGVAVDTCLRFIRMDKQRSKTLHRKLKIEQHQPH